MFSKLKQFKDLRDQAKQLKDSLAQETTEATAEGGRIKITMDGNQEILNVEIDTELITTDNKERIEAGIKQATNDAIKKIQKIMAEKMKSSGFSLPDM